MMLEDGSHGYSAVRQEFSQAIVVLMGLVATVFLIACANLATLLFVRGAGRLREMSIRFALGASRAHLVRQWMTECLLLSVLGGVAGLIAARWITDLLLYFVAEADRHHTNEFIVLVGKTAKGRKGSSWNHVYRLLLEADEEWARERVQSGLSSGEGLICCSRGSGSCWRPWRWSRRT